MKPRAKQFYEQFANHVKQHAQNCFPNMNFNPVGSRDRGDFKRTSDFDYQFCIQGGPITKEDFYPKLVSCIKEKVSNYRGEDVRVEMGRSGNVVNVFPGKGGKVSFALEPCEHFD